MHVYNDYHPNSVIRDTFCSSDIKTKAVKLYDLPVQFVFMYIASVAIKIDCRRFTENQEALSRTRLLLGDPPADGCVKKEEKREDRKKPKKQMNT